MDIRERLLQFMRAQPFVPFTILMTGGRQFVVTGPEWLAVGLRISHFAYVNDEGWDCGTVIHHKNIDTIDYYEAHQSPAAVE